MFYALWILIQIDEIISWLFINEFSSAHFWMERMYKGLYLAISLDLAVSVAYRPKHCISVETYGIAMGKD